MKLLPKLLFLCFFSFSVSAQHTTFFVDGKQLKDPCGNPIRLVGINKMSIFKLIEEPNADYFTEIAKTGANCVRIVWSARYPIQNHNGETVFEGEPTKISQLEDLIRKCIANKMIPIIEAHDATGSWTNRESVMKLWERQDIIDLIKKYEGWLIVNFGNEIGGNGQEAVSNDDYKLWYKNVIARLRSKGIKVPLMIDAPIWGKDMNAISLVGSDLLSFDSNLMFSVHTYWSNFDINKEGVTPQQFISGEFSKVSNLPIVIGELSKYGGDGDVERVFCGNNNIVSYNIIAQECKNLNFGYIAWEWGPGNAGGGDPLCVAMDMTTNSKFLGLKDWGLDLVENPSYGIRANAKKTDYFIMDCLCENVKLEIKSGSRVNILDFVYAWSSTSTNIQSYVLEVETFSSFHRPSVKKSLPFPSKINLPLLNAYQAHIGAASAKLKVFQKNGNSCYVSPR